MADKIHMMLSHTVTVTGSYKVIVTDDNSPGGRVNTLSTGSFTFLGTNGGAGTAANPWGLSDRLDRLLRTSGSGQNSLWTGFINTNTGKLTITYKGTSVTGSVRISGSSDIFAAYLFGWSTGSFGGSFAPNLQYAREAPHYAMGCFAVHNASPDTQWKPAPIDNAYTDTGDGTVYVLNNQVFRHTRKFTSNFHLYDPTQTTGSLSSSYAYPAKERWINPGITETSYVPPYSWFHFHKGARGAVIRLLENPTSQINNYLAGTATNVYWENVYLTADGLAKADIEPQDPYWQRYAKIKDIEFSFVSTGSAAQ